LHGGHEMESVGLWRFMIGANYFHLAMVIYLQLPYFRGAIKGHALLVRLLTYGVAVLLGTSVASSPTSTSSSTRVTVVARDVPPNDNNGVGGGGGGGGGCTATVVASSEATTPDSESACGEIRRETLLGEFTAAAEQEEEVDLSKKKNN